MIALPNLASAPPWARELLEAERVARLGLLDDDGSPRVLPVTFAVVAGDLWSAVDHKPKSAAPRRLARLRWLAERPAACLTVDRYSDDWQQLAWVQVNGVAAVLDAEPHDEVLAALAGRYPQYRERAPQGPLLRLVPKRVVCWRAAEG